MAYQTPDNYVNGYSENYHRRQPSSASYDIDQGYTYNEIDGHPASSSHRDSTPRSSSHQYYDNESVADSVASYDSSTAYSRNSVSSIATTAPSHAGPNHPTWTFGSEDPHNQDGDLWCEFCVVVDCDATFHLNEVNAWITHHLTHLHHTLPSTLVCWFCDDFSFSVHERAPLDDRQQNFVNRMRHIHGHIQDDESLKVESMRPDFSMADHMWNNRLITEGMYIAYKNYTELPPQLRIPGTPGSVSYDRYHQHGQSHQSQGGPLGLLTPPDNDENWYRSPQELARQERRRRRPEWRHR